MKGLKIILVVSLGAIIASSIPVEEQEKRLIKTSEDEDPKWLTEDEIWGFLIRKQRNFIDITDHPDMPTRVKPQDVDTSAIPTEIQYPEETRTVLQAVDGSRVEDFIRHFSSYHNRYYKAKTGSQSQKWLLSQVQEALTDYNGNSSVEEVEHAWSQRSIVARIVGNDPDLKSEVIILGAHQDSINMLGGTFRAPGADDNASGSATVLEALRSVVNSRFAPKRTVEFHWYAAEEVGLRGSAAIAQLYKTNDVNVVGMVNFDVVGYQDPRYNEVGIYTDNAHPVLVQFLRILVDEYLEYGRRDSTCGYGCSDHASWTNYGYAAAMPAEVTLHPLMHTGADDQQRVGFTQVKEFCKLATAFVVEFGVPSNTK